MTQLTIGQLARRTGLRTSALRYYEESGLLPTAARVNGRRVYDAGIVRRIDGVRFAQQAGFSLKEIRALFHSPSSRGTLSVRWQKMAQKKLSELDATTARIARMRQTRELGLRCGCVSIEDCTMTPAKASVPDARQLKTDRRFGC